MINVVQNGDLYDITFRYNPDILALVKAVPGRRWEAESKKWTLPKQHLGFLINQFKGTPFEDKLNIVSEEEINTNSPLNFETEIPDIDLSGMELYTKKGCKPFQHQLDFMKYAIGRNDEKGFILADMQGMGKTWEIMNLAMFRKDYDGYKHCLIITCVNSAKFSWREDILTHTQGLETPYILGTRIKRNGKVDYNGSGQEKLDDLLTGHMYSDKGADKLPYFLLLNIEALRTSVGKGKKSYPMVKKIAEMVNSDEIGMIAIDEVHKNMSPTSTQGKLMLEIKKATGSKAEWIPMTGTPIVNKPTDVFIPLKLVDGHHFRSYYKDWIPYFCMVGGYGATDIIGYKNIPELQKMLQGKMIRRLRENVLDLPPKIYYTEYIENTPVQAKLYEKIQKEMISDMENIITSLNPLSKMLRLRQVNGSPELIDPDNIKVDSDYISKNAKLKRLMELLAEIIDERGEKVIIFSNWVEPLKTVWRFVAQKYKACSFTGTMSEDARQENKKAFIENPECKVMLGTIGAMGVNHSFPGVQNVILYDEPWNPATREQAVDRAYGLGRGVEGKSTNVYTLITKDTIDETVNRILGDKELMSGLIVDGKIDIRKNPELFKQLIG
jgi:hypothetical protein